MMVVITTPGWHFWCVSFEEVLRIDQYTLQPADSDALFTITSTCFINPVLRCDVSGGLGCDLKMRIVHVFGVCRRGVLQGQLLEKMPTPFFCIVLILIILM